MNAATVETVGSSLDGETMDPCNVTLSITINGNPHEIGLAGSAALLDVIRDQLGLTGTK
jgi:hypothetical protein